MPFPISLLNLFGLYFCFIFNSSAAFFLPILFVSQPCFIIHNGVIEFRLLAFVISCVLSISASNSSIRCSLFCVAKSAIAPNISIACGQSLRLLPYVLQRLLCRINSFYLPIAASAAHSRWQSQALSICRILCSLFCRQFSIIQN